MGGAAFHRLNFLDRALTNHRNTSLTSLARTFVEWLSDMGSINFVYHLRAPASRLGRKSSYSES
jgi:hypothetical protein